jgi:hypothetical protein
MKKHSRTRFAKKQGNTSRQNITPQSNTGLISWKLYQDCKIPLNRFLDCLFDKDYDGLIIKGDPPEHDKLTAWHQIYMEYVQLTTDGSGNELYDSTIKMNYLSGKIFVVDKIIKHLYISYNPDLIKVLRYYGVDCGITDKDDAEKRYEKLKQVVGRVKRWITDLDILKKEFENLQLEHSDKSGGYDYFEDSLTNLSIFRKTTITSKDISVRQFVKGLKSIEREAIRLAAQQNA